MKVRGFNKQTVSDYLKAKITSSQEGEELKVDENGRGGFEQEFFVSDLI